LALIVGSALALYLVLAWMIGDGDGSNVALAMDKRVQALEEAQLLDRERFEAAQDAQGRGTLFRLLVSDPSLGDSMLKYWEASRLTNELGWPDQVQGTIWTYDPRTADGPGLRVIVDNHKVQGVQVLPAKAGR